jgi:heterodisulfide reductase subunit A
MDGFFMELHPELGPVETTTDGVFICGTIQGPKDIADSISQGTAAAIKASKFLVRDRVSLEATVAFIDEVLCRNCGTCESICPFNAPKPKITDLGKKIFEINPALCKGCGTCSPWCPTGAVTTRHFTDQQIHAMIDAFFLE